MGAARRRRHLGGTGRRLEVLSNMVSVEERVSHGRRETARRDIETRDDGKTSEDDTPVDGVHVE